MKEFLSENSIRINCPPLPGQGLPCVCLRGSVIAMYQQFFPFLKGGWNILVIPSASAICPEGVCVYSTDNLSSIGPQEPHLHQMERTVPPADAGLWLASVTEWDVGWFLLGKEWACFACGKKCARIFGDWRVWCRQRWLVSTKIHSSLSLFWPRRWASFPSLT